MRAWAVADLGFGDAGKGLLTDYLVRRTGARLVVRYNGGAQAGHNVVTADGRHHTFAQFGAGSFVDGVATLLSRFVVVHPTALLVEASHLEAKGVRAPLSRISISDEARVITPFQQAANRLRELARGEGRHGSCGVGLGETVADALAHPDDAVHAGDLQSAAGLRRKLERQRERRREELRAHRALSASEWSIFEEDGVCDAWLERVLPLAENVVAEESVSRILSAEETVIFEGAQGVLLDESFGFHPHTTWSSCTFQNAEALAGGAELTKVGVLRAHAVRHGAGPFPTEDPALSFSEHNEENPWQGRVRHGHFDSVLARYALRAVGGVDRLLLTHVDSISRVRLCARYDLGDSLSLPKSLEQQEQLARTLLRARPEYEDTKAEEAVVLGRIEALLGRSVDLISRGPRAGDVHIRRGIEIG